MPYSGYTKADVDNLVNPLNARVTALEGAPAPTVDLSNYYTKAEIDQLLAAVPDPTPDPDPTPTPDPTPAPNARFFAADSSWNTPIPSNATYVTKSAINSGGGWCNYDEYSVPVVFAKDSDPVVTINAPGTWGWPAQTLHIHIPVGQTGSSGTDGSMVVVDGNTAYDFWQFNRTGTNSATVESWAKSDIVNGSGWGQADPFLAAGIHATGSSLLAGLIVGDELSTGIFHAIGVGAGRNLAGPATGEAIASDGSSNGVLKEGLRLAVPRSVAMPTDLSPQGKVLWTAFQEYGAFVIDTAGGDPHAIILSADPNSVPSDDVAAILGPDWTASDLEHIVENLRIVA